MIIDTHAHLMLPEFDKDREEVISRARDGGLSAIINVGCCMDSSKKSVEMADGKFIYGTLGASPYEAIKVNDEIIKKWEGIILKDKENNEKEGIRKIVAIGETGLDYFKAKINSEIQKQAFKAHLELATKTNLPVIVHNREADEDCLEILRQFPKVKAVFHCYGTSLEFARKVWEAGYKTSFTAIITYPNAKELRGVVKEAPTDSFFAETDSPYLSPQSRRGERNEPLYVKEVLKCMAEVRGISLEVLSEKVFDNSRRFFNL